MNEAILELTEQLEIVGNIEDYDPEEAHLLADELLLAFIGSDAVVKAFEDIDKWYS